MAIEIARQNIATAMVESPTGVGVMDEVRGQYKGQVVQVTSEASKLLEAAEEVGMAVASRADRRSLGQRDIRAGRGTNAEAMARAKGQYEKLPDMPGEVELISLVDLLTSYQERMGSGRDGEASAEDILAALQTFDPDVTHQFAALDVARDHLEATGADPAFLKLLDEASIAFDRSDVLRDVRAGYAVAEIASREAATLESDPATVRDVYRGLLRDTADVSKIFEALRTFDPLKSLAEAIDLFTTAAGRDLASASPSSDPVFLHGLITELAKLKKVRTTLDATRQLVALTLRTVPPSQRGGVDVVEQASRILAFVSSLSAGPADARRLLGAFEDRVTTLQIIYANGLRSLHGDIHDAVFPSPQARQQQATAVMSLLDGLVEAEDRPVFKALDEGRSGIEFALADGTYSLGSGKADDIRIVDADLLEGHARLRIAGFRIEIAAEAGPVAFAGRGGALRARVWHPLDPLDVAVAGTLTFAFGPRDTDWADIADRSRRAVAAETKQASRPNAAPSPGRGAGR